MLGAENQSEQSMLNPHNYNPLGVMKHGCYYVTENLDLKNDGSEDVFGTLQEAKCSAFIISKHSLALIHVLDKNGNYISTFARGVETLAFQQTLEGIRQSKIGSDKLAREFGKAIWVYISKGYREVFFAKKKLSQLNLIKREHIETKQKVLGDMVARLEFMFVEDQVAFSLLSFDHIDKMKYRFREVETPKELFYSQKQISSIRTRGYIQTGQYAYQEGWNISGGRELF